MISIDYLSNNRLTENIIKLIICNWKLLVLISKQNRYEWQTHSKLAKTQSPPVFCLCRLVFLDKKLFLEKLARTAKKVDVHPFTEPFLGPLAAIYLVKVDRRVRVQ